MASPRTMSLAMCVSLVLLFASLVLARDQDLCSSTNTAASSYAGVYAQFQSSGACTGQCLGKYNYAVVQGQNCWCTNNAPSNTVSLSSCRQPCPGFGDEQCGSTADNLFGYWQLSSAFTDTKSATRTSSPTATSGFTSIITVTGQVQTITSMPTGSAQSVMVTQHGSSFSNSPGKIVGLAIGLTVLVALIIAAIVFFVLRRRRQSRESLGSSSPRSGNPVMRFSTASGNGMMDGYSRRSSTPGFPDQRLDPGAMYQGTTNLSNRSFQDNQDYSRRVLKVANPDE